MKASHVKHYDFFVSHAGEDKTTALAIANGLEAAGYRVWIDVGQLRVGDRLLQSISRGLSQCHRGVVLLSEHFFQKDWPQWELEGLFAIENAEHRKVILPVWHGIDLRYLIERYPILAGRLATDTARGIPQIVSDLVAARADHRDYEPAPVALAAPVVELLEREPLDFFADAEDDMERGNAASARIVTAMNEFTARVNEFNAKNAALAAAGRAMGRRELRSHINRIVPIFDDYANVLRDEAPAMGSSIGRALLNMARGLVASADATTSSANLRQQWLQSLVRIEESATESLVVVERVFKSSPTL